MFSLRKIDKELKPLLEFHSEEAVATMNKYGKVITITPGQTFFEEDKGGNEAAIILEGTAKATSKGKIICVLKEGTLVGESAMVTGKPRTASISAATLLKLVVLDAQAFSMCMTRCEEFNKHANTTIEERAA